MARISIDEARAKIWLEDVDAELKAVREITKKVNSINTENVGDNDSIMENIYSYASNVDNAWTRMCNSFDEAQDKLIQAVSKMIQSAESVIDDVDVLKSKIGQ